jgi:hypothetical protein
MRECGEKGGGRGVVGRFGRGWGSHNKVPEFFCSVVLCGGEGGLVEGGGGDGMNSMKFIICGANITNDTHH